MATKESFPSTLIQSLLSGSEVQNRVRTVGDFTLDMELVAVDGLVGAARLGGIQKGPVSALASALAELPPRIKTNLAEMEVICLGYARALSASAYIALRYQSHKDGLAAMRAEGKSDALSLTNIKHVEELQRSYHLAFEESLFEAREALRSVRAKLGDFEAIVRSVQHVGSYMAIEAAALEDGSGNFTSLAGEIHRQALRLADVLGALLDDTNNSELLMTNRNGGLAA